MKRRTLIINTVLGVAIVGVGAATAVSVSSAGSQPQPTGTVVSVQRGTVTATVTATGNVEAGSRLSVNPSGSGKVTKIYVKEGQRVDKGDKLVKIDDTSAKQDLETAEANLASAEASMITATQGRSAEDRQVDDAGVHSAETSLDNTRTALSQAKASYKLDKKQQNRLVSKAADAVDDAEEQKADDRAALDEAKTALTAAQQAGDTTAITQAQSTINQLQTAVGNDNSAVDSAKSSLDQAKQTRDKALLAGRQSIQTQEGQVSAAEDALASQKAQRTSAQQPARQGAIDSARAQIDNAQVAVDQAETALTETTVRAPVDGTVADITAVVGQSSSTTSAGSGGSDAGAGGGSGGASSAETSSAASGLLTLVDDSAKQVMASVAEADIVKVKIGQAVSVTLPASGRTLTGKVTSVATESTVVDNVVQYDVAISLPTANSAIRLGQTADVTITTASHADVLYVPTSAITTNGGHSVVARRVDGVDSVVEVQPGLVGADGTEIVRGLAERDQLVLPTGDSTGTYSFPDSSTTPQASTPSPSTSRSSR